MSLGRGRRDLDGLTGDFAREEERQRANAQPPSRQPSATHDVAEDGHPRPGLANKVLERIRRAIRG